MGWNITKTVMPQNRHYPIVIVTEKSTKSRIAKSVHVVLEETSLEVNIKRGYEFTKWISLPKI